jgi:hypothetical protein
MDVPMGRHLTRHRRQPDQVGSPRHHALPRPRAFEHLYKTTFPDAKFDGPSQESLAGRLDEYDRPPTVINESRFRNHRRYACRFCEQADTYCLINRDLTVPIVYLVDHWKRA